MTKKQLQEKYPGFSVKSPPLDECPCCRGEGEFKNAHGHMHVCACCCVSGDNRIRKLCMLALESTVQELLEKAHKERDQV